MKICCQCKESFSEEDFHKNKTASDGYQAACKECNKGNTLKRDPAYWRKHNLKRKFGITLEQYEELLVKQNYSCAICERHEDQFKIKLAVDHDHKTGRIRGLLCTACNYHLIRRHTDSSILFRMANYVDQGTDWFVPPKKKKKKIVK